MALVKYSNWPTLKSSESSDLFDDDPAEGLPVVHIKENKNTFEVELDAPGFNTKDFLIWIDQGLITIAGESRTERKMEDHNLGHREFGYTSFSRSFNLPLNIDEEGVQAKYEEDVLKISIPKKQLRESKTRRQAEIN